MARRGVGWHRAAQTSSDSSCGSYVIGQGERVRCRAIFNTNTCRSNLLTTRSLQAAAFGNSIRGKWKNCVYVLCFRIFVVMVFLVTFRARQIEPCIMEWFLALLDSTAN